jgi:F-type H+-transporting ATPase subunit b
VRIAALSVLFALSVGGAAFATSPPPNSDGAHGAAAGSDPHGEAAEAHGGGGHGAEATCYTCDDDHDGTQNWSDPDAGHSYALGSLGWHALNLALFIGILAYFAGPAIRSNLASRALAIRAEIDEATKVKAEAKARSEALRARLSRLESEIAALQQAARDEGAAEETRIEQRAQEAAARVAETAQRQIRDEAARARHELRREAVELAVKLAEGIVREQVQATDQRRLAQEFLDIVQQADGTEGRHV